MAKKKRFDGRKPDEIRPLVVKAGVTDRANGSAFVQTGNTKVIASVYGPRKVLPKHLEDTKKAILRIRYNMLPFSVKDRKKPGPDRRSIEIGKVIRDALTPVLFLEEFPRSAIDIDLEVIQADAGTRVASLIAAAVALADAGIPMKDLVGAIAVGRVEGQIVADLTKEEEDVEDAIDMPIAMTARDKKITLLQMYGIADVKEIDKMIELASKKIEEIAEAQREALREKYNIF